jgi:hypothetical protein
MRPAKQNGLSARSFQLALGVCDIDRTNFTGGSVIVQSHDVFVDTICQSAR